MRDSHHNNSIKPVSHFSLINQLKTETQPRMGVFGASPVESAENENMNIKPGYMSSTLKGAKKHNRQVKEYDYEQQLHENMVLYK